MINADLYERYLQTVKIAYSCSFADFIEWLNENGDLENRTVEIPKGETKTGVAVILKW